MAVAGFLSFLVLTLALASRAEAFVYWTESFGNTIGRANLDGTGVDKRFITGAEYPRSEAEATGLLDTHLAAEQKRSASRVSGLVSAVDGL